MVDSYELEVTSNCNALCTLCPRVNSSGDGLHEKHVNRSISIDQFKTIFKDPKHVDGKKFNFCGLSGDCLANKDFPEIVRFLADHSPSKICIHTNGSMGKESFWHELGELSIDRPVLVYFAVDGLEGTNEKYRRGVNFSKVIRNMRAFADANQRKPQMKARWRIIDFDWNNHEFPEVKQLCNEFNFEMEIKISQRNTKHSHMKGKEKRVKINATKKLEDNETKTLDAIAKKSYTGNELFCRYVHENDLYIANDCRVWPCCFLHYEFQYGNHFHKRMDKLLNTYGENFNSLLHHSLDDILQNNWFQSSLKKSFNPDDPLHFEKCYYHCSKNRGDVIKRV